MLWSFENLKITSSSLQFQRSKETKHLNTSRLDKSKIIDKGDRSISINLFIKYISNQICYSDRGYIEMKINKHEIW